MIVKLFCSNKIIFFYISNRIISFDFPQIKYVCVGGCAGDIGGDMCV